MILNLFSLFILSLPHLKGRRALKFYLTLFLSSLIDSSPSTSTLNGKSTSTSQQEIESIEYLLSDQNRLDKLLHTTEVLGDRIGREWELEKVMRWRAALVSFFVLSFPASKAISLERRLPSKVPLLSNLLFLTFFWVSRSFFLSSFFFSISRVKVEQEVKKVAFIKSEGLVSKV